MTSNDEVEGRAQRWQSKKRRNKLGVSRSNAWLGHRSQKGRTDANKSHNGERLKTRMDIDSQASDICTLTVAVTFGDDEVPHHHQQQPVHKSNVHKLEKYILVIETIRPIVNRHHAFFVCSLIVRISNAMQETIINPEAVIVISDPD